MEPQLQGSFSDLDLPDVDIGSLNSTSVRATFEVDERGRVHNVKFPSTGNHQLDDALRSSIQGFRFKPKVINGVAESVVIQHTFDIGQ